MPFIDTGQLSPKHPLPGWEGRFFHSDQMTFAYYEIEPQSSLHAHHHANEEVWHIIEGELELTLGQEMAVLRAGQAAVIPPDVEHSVSTTQHCRVIVVDHPRRDSVAGIDIG